MATVYSKEIKTLIEDIEVPDSEYERAVNRYNSIASYISDSDMREDEPEIYLQGSFKLGTAIKPLTEDGSYDIDLVCNISKLTKQNITQSNLKKKIGVIVKNYASSNNMKSSAEDGKRCWTLKYVDNHNFHLDILPAVPDGCDTVIAITDKRNTDYEILSNNWEISDPKGYFEWFNKSSKYDEFKKSYVLNEAACTEQVPFYKVKTPLQRVVQILKRHAEVMFDDNMEYKPSSIIITTLATKAYCMITNTDDFFSLIQEVILKLELCLDYKDGKACVLNPVNQREDLSIKWQSKETYFEEFRNWLEKLKFDFSVESSIHNVNEQFALLNRSMHKISTGTQLSESVSSLPYHLKLKWKDNMWKDVSIKATAYQKSFLPKKLNSGQAIGKNADIKFEVQADNLSLYDIYWQITNTGYEAQKANQLRGDFYESHVEEGKKIRKESTSYFGKHYVEAFLIKDGTCFGKSEPFVVNIVRGAFILR